MTLEDRRAIAAEVVRALGGNIMQAELPESAATIIRERARGGSVYEVHTFSTLGPMALSMQYTFLPSGGIHLELRSPMGEYIWHGTLRPRPVIEEVSGGDGS